MLATCGASQPPVWPEQFTIVQRKVPVDGGDSASVVTYYDYKAKANLLLITPDANASDVLFDLELDSGDSYYYRPGRRSCRKIEMPVGILRPDWLANATYLGPRTVNGRATLAWTKADFIDYYADAETCEPVRWYFHSMEANFDTLYYAAGATVPDPSWFKPPSICDGDGDGDEPTADDGKPTLADEPDAAGRPPRLSRPCFASGVYRDMHDGDAKRLNFTAGRLTIEPHNNTQRWAVHTKVDPQTCRATVDFRVPGKPNPPPVALSASPFFATPPGAEPAEGPRSFVVFTDPSGTIAAPPTPLNAWVSVG